MRTSPTDCGATVGRHGAGAGAGAGAAWNVRRADRAARLRIARVAATAGSGRAAPRAGWARCRRRSCSRSCRREHVLERRAAGEHGEQRQQRRQRETTGQADERFTGWVSRRDRALQRERPRRCRCRRRRGRRWRSEQAGCRAAPARPRPGRLRPSGVIGRRSAAPHRPSRAIAHLVGAGLGSTNRCLCSGSSLQVDRASPRCASPAIAATHSSCIARGATLAVTLTLPWPPSSISATAVPSSPE